MTKANLVLGPRQVGKSTLIWRWTRAHDRALLFVDGEEPVIREWSRSAARMAAELRDLLRPEMAVLIDEAQRLPDAGLTVKGLVDRCVTAPLFVTGSSSFHLQARTRESLAGRASRAVLHPLRLDEIVDPPDDTPPAIRAMGIRRAALRQMVVGGYPEVWLSDQPTGPLRELLESFIVRDASDLYRVKHLDAFRRLLSLVARQAGDLVNFSEWAALCEVSRDTVRNYIDLLCETHILYRAFPFVGGKGAEVDFVVDRPGGLLAYEAGATELCRPKLTRSARSFIEAYAPRLFVVANLTLEASKRLGETEVRWLPPEAFADPDALGLGP